MVWDFFLLYREISVRLVLVSVVIYIVKSCFIQARRVSRTGTEYEVWKKRKKRDGKRRI